MSVPRTGHAAAPVRVAFAGVAHSHPFSDAGNLRRRGAQLAAVWDADDPARRADFAERFGVPVCDDLSALLAARPDVVVATPRTPRAAEVASACAAAGVPVFFNKTVAAHTEGLDAWRAVPQGLRATSSVLRFAPDLATFATGIADRPLLALDVHVQHDITAFLHGDRAWQDDPAGAGGTMLNIGVHAWEMVDVLVPGARVEILSAVATRAGITTASELLATVHARCRATSLTVTVSGVAGPDRYALRAITADGTHELVLPAEADGLGYGGTADAILRLAAGEKILSPERTDAVYENAIGSAEIARAQIL